MKKAACECARGLSCVKQSLHAELTHDLAQLLLGPRFELTRTGKKLQTSWQASLPGDTGPATMRSTQLLHRYAPVEDLGLLGGLKLSHTRAQLVDLLVQRHVRAGRWHWRGGRGGCRP